jgi:hypothetical protein
MQLEGCVTFADALYLEITVGKPPKPEAKLYCDGNPLLLKVGEQVIVETRRHSPACHLSNELERELERDLVRRKSSGNRGTTVVGAMDVGAME